MTLNSLIERLTPLQKNLCHIAALTNNFTARCENELTCIYIALINLSNLQEEFRKS